MVSLSLEWTGDLTFASAPGSPSIRLQSSSPDVPSPPQVLAYAIMGCMAMDLVHVLRKAHQSIDALVVRLEGRRADEHPRRFVEMTVRFELTGRIDPAIVERAIQLSKTTYCSVWHTIRPDVELETTFSVRDPDAAAAT